MGGFGKMVEITDPIYEFKVAEGDARTEALKFIEDWAFQAYNCRPPATEGIIVGAWGKDGIAGTISIDIGGPRKPFPLEAVYDLEEVKKIVKFNRKKIVQIGRWYAKVPEISLKLIESAALIAEPLGAKFLLCEGKPNSVRRVEQLGLKFILFCGLRPRMENIPAECRLYYEKAPEPKPALIFIDSVIRGG